MFMSHSLTEQTSLDAPWKNQVSSITIWIPAAPQWRICIKTQLKVMPFLKRYRMNIRLPIKPAIYR